MRTPPTFDYIVVGAGSAGCVVAARLSRKGSVLLLERGVSDTYPRKFAEMIARPDKVLKAIFWSGSDKAYKYLSEPQPGLLDRSIEMLRGLVRGGCSSVNGMVYVRGNRRDFDLWAQLGNEGWSFEDVLPFFRRSENHSDGASEYHGAGGPLDVRPLPRPSAVAFAFIDAARRLRFPDSSPYWDFNGPRQENAAGLYHVNVSRDLKAPFPFRRASAAFAFLDSAPPSLTTKITTQVSRIILDGRRAVGVECLVDGKKETYRAEHEVILSAGVFESPKLLMLSGIGPKDHLTALKIPVIEDLPGVGENLQDHLQTLIFHWAKYYAGVSDFTAQAGLFTRTTGASDVTSPDLQYHVLAGMKGWFDPVMNPYFIICPVLLKPQSRGFVRLDSRKPLGPPQIQPNYLQCGADVDVLVHGIALAHELVRAGELGNLFDDSRPPFAIDPLAQPRGVPDPRSSSDKKTPIIMLPASSAGWPHFIRQTVNTVWHPVGTCKMGRDHLAVVDPQLKVRGVEGLRVADASIMPVIPSGNTNAACYMIGEKCAELVGG